eukprot:1507447-Rhodomonas_salina.4
MPRGGRVMHQPATVGRQKIGLGGQTLVASPCPSHRCRLVMRCARSWPRRSTTRRGLATTPSTSEALATARCCTSRPARFQDAGWTMLNTCTRS